MAADPLTTSTVNDLMLQDAAFDTDDDSFADKPPRNVERDDKPTLSPRKRKADDENPFGGAANIDEEVKITKQRKKIPKLDADRLLSEPGIPKVRQLIRSGGFKKKLRLKGKGHEFSDAARLLNYYQMWLDQLYPRAKFADALQLVEKAGHTKKLQMYRKAWIDESKPGYVRREDVEQAVENQDTAQNDSSAPKQSENGVAPEQDFEDDPAALFFTGGDLHDEQDVEGPDEDELDALLAQGDEAPIRATNKRTPEVESEGEDDLDALLAQQESHRRKPSPVIEEEDELDALMQQHHAATNIPQQQPSQQVQQQEVDEDEDDELDAILNDESHPSLVEQPINAQNDASASTPNLFDLDAAMHNFNTLPSHHPPAPEPDLPPPPIRAHLSTPNPKPHPQTQKSIPPTTEELPPLDANALSSSPLPNIQTDELDALLDEHDATVIEKQNLRFTTSVDPEIVGGFGSSSPIPNGRESQ